MIHTNAKYILSILSFVVLSACNTTNQEAAMTMVVQTFEARGTVAAESAAATQVGATEIVLAEIAEATDIAQAEIAEVTAIALTEAAKATATPTRPPTVTPTATLDPQTIKYLVDLEPVYETSLDFAPIYAGSDGVNSVQGRAGERYRKGIETHAPSKIIYNLKGNYTKIFTTITMGNCNCYDDDGAVFIIMLDNKIVYESPLIKQSRTRTVDSVKNIEIDVTNASTLTLITNNGPNGQIRSDHTIWGDPYLVIADIDTPEPTPAVTSTPASTTGTIQGQVYWASTGDPVEGVILGLGDTEVNSDADGHYVFADLVPGSYSFTLRWEFDFDGGDTPCAGLDAATMITGNWFTNFVALNAGDNMVVAIQNDVVEVKAGESTTFDIVFTCGG